MHFVLDWIMNISWLWLCPIVRAGAMASIEFGTMFVLSFDVEEYREIEKIFFALYKPDSVLENMMNGFALNNGIR